MKQLVVRGPIASDGRFAIEPRQARHLAASRRLEPGAVILCVDATGNRFHARVLELTSTHGILIRLPEGESAARAGAGGSVVPQRAALRGGVEVCAAVLKGRKLDDAVRSLVELGVMAFRPVFSERCIVPSDRIDARRERWLAIVDEAVEQSGRPDVPVLRDPLTLPELAARGAGIAFHEAAEREIDLHEALARVVADRPPLVAAQREARVPILIGPEGGLSPTECSLLRQNDWQLVRLPFPVLRAETAVVVAATLVQSALTP